jgi:excinuclease ABC subunit C
VVGIGRSDTDVVAWLARQDRTSAVAVLVLRGGRVVGKESRLLDHAEPLGEAGAARIRAEPALSAAAASCRGGIVLGSRCRPAPTCWAEALAHRAGHPVELAAPTRGPRAPAGPLAESNAAHALETAARARRSPRAPRARDARAAARARASGSALPRRVFRHLEPRREGAVAAVVASEGGRPRRGLYRRMRIRRPGPDDFAMIAEAVTRYWTRVESGELPRPDLVLVDGGAGQLSAAPPRARRREHAAGLAARPREARGDGGARARGPRCACRCGARRCARSSACATRRTASACAITAWCAGGAGSRARSTPCRRGPARRRRVLSAFGSCGAARRRAERSPAAPHLPALAHAIAGTSSGDARSR